MTTNSHVPTREIIRLGVLAGVAGGFAEVFWIWIYGVLSGIDAGLIARGISEAIGAGDTVAPLALGIVIHMILAVALGVVLVIALCPIFAHLGGIPGMYASMTLILMAVWAVNFLVVLPQISPTFVHLVPYQVSLLSKVLFGFAAAAVLGVSPRHADTFSAPRTSAT